MDYREYPNLMRVARELARCEQPHKVLHILSVLLENSVQDSADGSKDFGLLVGDVASLPEIAD